MDTHTNTGEEHLPRVMACGHSFCTTCLHSWWAAAARSVMRCPHCNVEHDITGVENIPINYALTQ